MADVWFHDVARYVYLYWYQVSLRVYYGCRYVYIRGDFFYGGLERHRDRCAALMEHGSIMFIPLFYFSFVVFCSTFFLCAKFHVHAKRVNEAPALVLGLEGVLTFSYSFYTLHGNFAQCQGLKKEWKSQILQGKKIMLTTCSITNAHSAILLKADIILFTTGDTTCSPPLLCLSRTVVIKMCWIFLVLKTSMEHVES